LDRKNSLWNEELTWIGTKSWLDIERVGGMARNHGSDVSGPERMMELTMELSKPAENWVMSGLPTTQASLEGTA